MAPQPFRFLDLPPEIRVLVYEQLCPQQTIYMQICRAVYTWRKGYVHKVPDLNSSMLCVDLLRTCRIIYSEAVPILYRNTTFDIEFLPNDRAYGDIKGRRLCWLQDFIIGSKVHTVYLRGLVPRALTGVETGHTRAVEAVLQKLCNCGPAARVHMELRLPPMTSGKGPQFSLECFKILQGAKTHTVHFAKTSKGNAEKRRVALKACKKMAKAMGASVQSVYFPIENAEH